MPGSKLMGRTHICLSLHICASEVEICVKQRMFGNLIFFQCFFSKWVRSNTKLVLQKFLIKTIIELVVAKKSILKGKCQIKSSCLWHNLIANPSTFFILPEKLQLVHWNCLEVDSLTREVIILSIILIYQQSVPVLPAYTQHTLIRFLIKMRQIIVNNRVRPWWRNY